MIDEFDIPKKPSGLPRPGRIRLFNDDGTLKTIDANGREASVVGSDPTGVTGADVITNAVSLTQAEYDAISAPDAATLYVIVG